MASIVASDNVRAAVDAALRGKKRDVGGTVFSAILLSTLLISLAVLVILLADHGRERVARVPGARSGVRDQQHVLAPGPGGCASGLDRLARS